jgi:hypothetical protein
MAGFLAFSALITAQFIAVLYVHRWYTVATDSELDGGRPGRAQQSLPKPSHGSSDGPLHAGA